MGQAEKPPALSAEGQKALHAFRSLPFTGGGQAEGERATLAACAMYQLPYDPDAEYVVNTSMEGLRTTEQQVRTFVDATQQLLNFLENPRPQHFDISKMGGTVGSQSDAKQQARALITALRAEVQRDFSKEYGQAVEAMGEDQHMWRR